MLIRSDSAEFGMGPCSQEGAAIDRAGAIPFDPASILDIVDVQWPLHLDEQEGTAL